MNKALTTSHNVEAPRSSSHRVMDKQFQMPDGPDQLFYYRMDMTPPILRAGWQTDQAANSKDLSFRLNPTYFQSNPRIGKNSVQVASPASPYVPVTNTGGTKWNV